MKHKSNLRFIFCIAVISIFALTMFPGCKRKETAVKETFKVGMVAPLSGTAAYLGEGMRNAMLLAKDHLKNTKYNYEIVVEDDQLDPKVTASAANKLINVDKVDAIVSIEAGPGNVVSHLATSNNKIHFGITAVSGVANGVNNFLHWTPAIEQARVLVNELRKKGIKKVGIFRSVSLEDWLEYVEAVRTLIKDTDIKIVTEQTFTDDQKDFRSFIAKAKETKPDIYFFVVPTPALEILTKQLREAGDNTPLTSIESFEATEEPQLFEGYWYVSAAEPAGGYTTSYKEKYHKNPTICSGNVYDIFNLIVTAVENAKSSSKPSAQEISAELKKLKNYSGAMGPLSVGDNGVVLSKAQLKMIRNGKITPVGE
ncbi:MAG: ABC transporter substrate-binding protein [Nitrospirae bacterium]|nr:ABC transporter substrate-binding protein [Nitrospirota bacterium]